MNESDRAIIESDWANRIDDLRRAEAGIRDAAKDADDPAVALGIADWLHIAGRDLWAHGMTDDDDDLLSPHLRAALIVARAYLDDEAAS